jgi:hypothetical protein
MARTYFAAVAAVAICIAIAVATANAYPGSGASRYERVSEGDGSCSYSGVGTPDPAYYTPRDPNDLLTCTDVDYLVLGCYEGYLDDCDALSDLVGDYGKGTVGHDIADYGWSCGHRLRWRDDWPGNSPARSCHDIDWSHG